MSEDYALFRALLSKAEILDNNIIIEKISRGANNRSFKITSTKGFFVIKEYFTHYNDRRNRLENEFSFLEYAHSIAPNWVPQPLIKDTQNMLGLYEFIEGKQYTLNDIKPRQVNAAAEFFVILNQKNHKKIANKMPTASEACFSIKSHIDIIKNRIDFLCNIEIASDIDRAAQVMSYELKEITENLILSIKNKAKKSKINILEELDADHRCVSPSDFGFHNALNTQNEQPIFIDFEYAGWDDPAKMVGDFFSQLAVPISSKYMEQFTQKCMEPFPDPDKLILRAYLLAPLYKIKWCCIALNIFLPLNFARRKFANSFIDEVEVKRNQLEKAQGIINTLGDKNYGIH